MVSISADDVAVLKKSHIILDPRFVVSVEQLWSGLMIINTNNRGIY